MALANEARVARAGTGARGLSGLVCLSGELIQTLDYPGAAAVTRTRAGVASTRVSARDDVRGRGGTRVGRGMSLARAKFTNLPRLDDALEWIAASAAERDRAPLPPFPEEAIFRLEQAGTLARTAQPTVRRPPAADELGLVRAVARADGSVGRIFDGHLNAVERLAVQAPEDLRDAELAAVQAGGLRLGVWGADPRPGEGPPATVVREGGEEVLGGVKTFCSGAGGLDRALVLARDPEATAPAAVWVDLTQPDRIEIDERWYRGAGLRASVSHRVVFRGARVMGRIGPPGALSAQPWFARDALRTAASWAGMADSALEGALAELARLPRRGALEELAAGRMLTAHHTITAWMERAARAMDGATSQLPAVALHGRAAIAGACGALLDEAARACGSHPFATGELLDRSRRDLELFLLQHRLDPGLAAAGAAALEAHE
jgi:alkylation response protein AidB-like acyl-CoA dehydrogenase